MPRPRCAAGNGTASASKALSCAARRWASWGWAASAVTSRSRGARSGCRWSATIRTRRPSARARCTCGCRCSTRCSAPRTASTCEALVAGDLSFAINVPGMGGDLLRRLAPLLDLARRLGRLALALADGPVKAVEVAYGGKEEAAQRPVLVSALEGLLAAMNAGPVSLVNAQVLAEEKGIQLGTRTGAPEAGFETPVRL